MEIIIAPRFVEVGMPDNKKHDTLASIVTPPGPSTEGTLLDILEQLQGLSLDSKNADGLRLLMLSKLDEVGKATAQLPNMLWRMEQMEELLANHEERLRIHTAFKIKLEAEAGARKGFYAIISVFCGGIGAAFMTFMLNYWKPH